MQIKSFSLRGLRRYIIAYEWLILILLFPIFFFFNNLSVRIIPFPIPLRIAFLLVIPFLWYLRKIEFGRFFISTPFDLSILLMLVMVLISLFVTFDILISISGVAGIVYGVGIFYATVASASRCRESLARGIGFLLIFGLLIASLTLIGTDFPARYSPLTRLARNIPLVIFFPNVPYLSGGINSNGITGILMYFIPVSIVAVIISIRDPGFWHTEQQRWKGLLPLCVGVIVFLLTIVTLVLSQSRAGYLASMASLFILGYGVWGKKHGKKLMLLLIILGIIIIGAWLSFSSDFVFSNFRIIDDVITLVRENFPSDSLQGRLELWSRALYGIEDYSFTGMGMGTFGLVTQVLYPMYIDPQLISITHAHNILLQIALDLGIPGLIAFLAIWIGVGSALWKTWRFGSSKSVRLLASGFSATLVGFIVFSMTTVMVYVALQGLWLLLGLTTSLYLLEQEPSESIST